MTDQAPVIFKRKKIDGKFIRKTQSSIDEKDDSTENIEVLKEYQSLRKKGRGLIIETFNSKDLNSYLNTTSETDIYKLRVGGLVNLAQISNKKSKKIDTEEPELDIGTGFSKETNKRDEDTEMMKFIEEELEKRKRTDIEVSESKEKLKKSDDALDYVSEHLKKSSVENKKNKSEEMMSNQMLSGIPEVNLGIESKIRNIEATEQIKQRIFENKYGNKFSDKAPANDASSKNSRRGKKQQTSFVPTNVAVNFLQHNRYNFEENTAVYLNPINFTKYKRENTTGEQNLTHQPVPEKPQPKVKIQDEGLKQESFRDKIIKEKLIEAANTMGVIKQITNNVKHQQTQHTKNVNTNRKEEKNSGQSMKNIPADKASDDFHFEKFRKQFSR